MKVELVGFWNYFWFYFPLGVIGFWRWGVWLFKKICASRYRPIVRSPSSNNTTLSIITPVYLEEPEIFRKALKSWQANNPDEIIAVIDHSDGGCIGVFEDFAKNNLKAKLIVTSKPGKRAALADGIQEARSEIVALVDSDTIWDRGVKEKALAPFNDPKIGGMVTRQNSLENQTVWQKMTDIFWDLRNADEWPSLAATGKALTCLSGRTAFYRREILLPKLDEFLNEILLGRRKESGDDKCLTRLVQKDGWMTYYQSSAQVWSKTASDFKTFWSQRVRWSRNSFNSDFTALGQSWVWKHPYLAFYMIDRFISPFTLLLAPIFFCLALYFNHWIVAICIICWWMFSRGIKIIPHLKRRPEDISVLPAYTGINFLVAVARIYALVTIREQRWIRGTEEREDKKGIFQKAKGALAPSFLTGGIISGLVALVILMFVL